MVCILEEDRTEAQKEHVTMVIYSCLCKLDQDCAIFKIGGRKKEIQNLEDQLGGC